MHALGKRPVLSQNQVLVSGGKLNLKNQGKEDSRFSGGRGRKGNMGEEKVTTVFISP